MECDDDRVSDGEGGAAKLEAVISGVETGVGGRGKGGVGVIEHEHLFARLGEPASSPNDTGRQQFRDHQSRGIVPITPDAYYLQLERGKRWADLQTESYRQLYFSDEWWGWHMILQDFLHDEDAYHYYFSWCRERPPCNNTRATLDTEGHRIP